MAVAAWAASTAFSVGDIRRPSTGEGTGLSFRCTTAGTSASSEPSWPNFVGDTVTDGTCVWTAISAVYDELLKLNPSAIIELFEVRLDSALHGSSDIYRFHAGSNAKIDGNIIFDGNTYSRIPVVADGFEYTNTGTLPRPTLTISNLDNTITALLLVVNAQTAGNDLGGAEVRRIRTLRKYLDAANFVTTNFLITQGGDQLITQSLDSLVAVGGFVASADPNARFPDERWFIDRKSSETRDSVTFELASKFDLAGQKIPKRQVIANICQWKYRSSECSYTGTDYYDVNGNEVSTEAQDVCGKRVASCKLRFGENAELPFGSFPGAGLTK
jgi:phage-related protein